MEASTETPAEPLVADADEFKDVPTEHSDAEKRNTQELYRYSEWLHIGPGAEECEDSDNGRCADPLHFHAWCRLPNQFQHKAIRDKALAAKARKIRSYRDAESDDSAILDGELDEIEYSMGAEASRSSYIEEIVYKDFMKDYFEVVQAMIEEQPEDGEETAEWTTIAEDQERLAALKAMDPEERPKEEYEQLLDHVAAYEKEVQTRVEGKQEPIRVSLQERPLDELRSMVREQRVQKAAHATYMEVYVLWEQFIGTLKPRDPSKGMPTERVFGSVEHLKASAPEVVEALKVTFEELDGEFGKGMTAQAMGKG
jgi:hypothetical protein